MMPSVRNNPFEISPLRQSCKVKTPTKVRTSGFSFYILFFRLSIQRLKGIVPQCLVSVVSGMTSFKIIEVVFRPVLFGN